MASPWRKFIEQNSLRRDFEELRDLSVQYVKEETVDPIKDLGRYAAFGALGSLFVGLGSLLFLVGLLRILQTETAVFHGNLSWVPYLIVIVFALAILGIVAWRVVSGPAQRRLPKPEKTP